MSLYVNRSRYNFGHISRPQVPIVEDLSMTTVNITTLKMEGGDVSETLSPTHQYILHGTTEDKNVYSKFASITLLSLILYSILVTTGTAISNINISELSVHPLLLLASYDSHQ